MITDDYIMTQLSEAGKLIRKLVSNRVYKSDDRKREWIKRYFGSSAGLYQEVFQELSLRLFENRSVLTEQEIKDQIYLHLRKSLVSCFRRREVDLQYGKGMLSYFDILPDTAPLAHETIDGIREVENDTENIEMNVVTTEIDHVKLTNIEKNVLKYRYFDDMDYDAICGKLGIGKSTAKQHCSNATSKLRTHFILKHPEIYANRASK